MSNKQLWTLKQALALIRKWQPLAWGCGLHLALAGSVLNRGDSVKDLDIIVMGMNNGDAPNWHKFKRLTGIDTAIMSVEDYLEMENALNDGRKLYKSAYRGKRIDFFVYGAND